METKLSFKCALCPEVFPHFKALQNHYVACHEKRIKAYEIINQRLDMRVITYATSIKEALAHFGWDRQECSVRRLE